MLRFDRRDHHLFWDGKTMVITCFTHIASKYPVATIDVDKSGRELDPNLGKTAKILVLFSIVFFVLVNPRLIMHTHARCQKWSLWSYQVGLHKPFAVLGGNGLIREGWIVGNLDNENLIGYMERFHH